MKINTTRDQRSDASRVVVYGGSGFFGHLVVQDLLRYTTAEVVVASRHSRRKEPPPDTPRLTFAQSDLNDLNSVRATIEGAKVVICCVGPFQKLSTNLLRACIQQQIHYVDVADDREFVLRCHELGPEIKQAGIMAFVGCSVVPGISSLLARFCQDRTRGQVDTIRVFILPGTKHPRGNGSFLCLLDTVGRSFSIPRDGQPMMIRGWTGREKVCFPLPMGERWVYFVVDIADYYLHPKQFGARTVEFKIGSELDMLNGSLEVVRWLKETFHFQSLSGFVPLFKAIVGLAGIFGTTQGVVMVEVSTGAGEEEKTTRMAVFTGSHGEVIPALLPSIATETVLASEINCVGIVPLQSWLSEERFKSELHKRNILVALKTHGETNWQPLLPEGVAGDDMSEMRCATGRTLER